LREGERRNDGGRTERWKEKIKKLKKKLKRKEREERRRNVVIKGLKEKDDNKKGLEGVWKKLRVGVNVKGVRRAETGGGRRGDIWIVKEGSVEENRRILQNK